MVAQCQGEISKLSIIRDVGVDGDRVLSFVTQIVEELCNASLALHVGTEGVGDPDLAKMHGRGECGALGVAGDELDVLDSAAVWDGDGGDDGPGGEAPETQRVCLLDAVGGLEDGQGDDEIRGQDDVLVKVDAQTVRGELFAKNVEKTVHVLWPFVEDVALSISFRQAVREMCRLHCPYM